MPRCRSIITRLVDRQTGANIPLAHWPDHSGTYDIEATASDGRKLRVPGARQFADDTTEADQLAVARQLARIIGWGPDLAVEHGPWHMTWHGKPAKAASQRAPKAAATPPPPDIASPRVDQYGLLHGLAVADGYVMVQRRRGLTPSVMRLRDWLALPTQEKLEEKSP